MLFRATFDLRGSEKARGESSTARNLVALGAMGATTTVGKDEQLLFGWKMENSQKSFGRGVRFLPAGSFLGCTLLTTRDLSDRVGTVCRMAVIQ